MIRYFRYQIYSFVVCLFVCRHYWIQELCWTHDDLYVAGMTKHGALFLVSRLASQPLVIHAQGVDVNMGPALYLTLHPLIVFRFDALNSSQQF